jgi:hypothetical protein
MTSVTAKSKETTINAKGNQNNDHERKPRQFAVVSIQSTLYDRRNKLTLSDRC